MGWLWLGVTLAFLIAEVLTTAFFALFGALGAAAAALAAFAGFGYGVQAIVFAAVSLAGLLLARPPLMRYLARRREPALLSGAQEMVGKTAILVEAIKGPNQRGHVQISGESWPALTEDGSALQAGSEVVITGLRQATLVVAPTKERSTP